MTKPENIWNTEPHHRKDFQKLYRIGERIHEARVLKGQQSTLFQGEGHSPVGRYRNLWVEDSGHDLVPSDNAGLSADSLRQVMLA